MSLENLTQEELANEEKIEQVFQKIDQEKIDQLTKELDEIIAELTQVIEAHYDAIAQTKRYDNRFTCALRAGYTGPFQAEGVAFAQWMDTCNAYGYQVMADCLAALRPVPTEAELIAELPPIVWP